MRGWYLQIVLVGDEIKYDVQKGDTGGSRIEGGPYDLEEAEYLYHQLTTNCKPAGYKIRKGIRL